MTTSNTVTLPNTISSLQDFMVKSISHFQGSPAKSERKIKESLAVGLNFADYNQLSAALPKLLPETPEVGFLLGNAIFIGDINIDEGIFDNELVNYKLVDRDEEVLSLIEYLADGPNHQEREIFMGNLRYLLSIDDKFLFSSVKVNEFVAASDQPGVFNGICERIISEQKTRYGKLSEDEQAHTCPHCCASLRKPDSVVREYVNKDEDGESVYANGHYENGVFESTRFDGFGGGRFDLLDDSDSCATCCHVL